MVPHYKNESVISSIAELLQKTQVQLGEKKNPSPLETRISHHSVLKRWELSIFYARVNKEIFKQQGYVSCNDFCF
jgi:hypothetical protein